MLRPLLHLACAAALAGVACAQGATTLSAPPPLAEQITPFTVWLDFNSLTKPDAEKPALPIWFESIATETTPATNAAPPKTVFRLRLRRMPALHRELLLRVYFDDLPDMQPVVTGWSETGKQRFGSPLLGDGIGLPTNETLVVPLDGVDYLDLEVPGDGSTIRGTFATSLKETTVLQTNDLAAAAPLADPFGAAAPMVLEEDQKVFGRVKAMLDPGIVRLSPADGTSEEWLFNIALQPLVTIVTFEVLNADLTSPPVVFGNDGEPVYASVHWPDLADPGFRGEGRPLEPSMRFQYTGWLKAQAVIPGHVLHSGVNKVTIGLSENSGPIAVRNVELQLKQNWKHFDYILSPVNP